MTAIKADIISQLQKEILSIQGFRKATNSATVDICLGAISNSFPNHSFPVGAMHEFIYTGNDDSAATAGFIAGLLATLTKSRGVAIWIGAARNIFPPALKLFGMSPELVIFIELQKEKEILWAMEEALRCDGLAAVIAQIKELSFKDSRRLQLAVEKSKVTGFILRQKPGILNTTACVARWQITSLPSELANGMPGVGFPRWNVELLKVRNGKPGKWEIECIGGNFRPIYKTFAISAMQKKKTG